MSKSTITLNKIESEILKKLYQDFIRDIELIKTSKDVFCLKPKYFGKSSIINQEMKKLGKMDASNKAKFGQQVNIVKSLVQEAMDSKRLELEEIELNDKLNKEALDITIPARERKFGSIHPITQAMEELVQVFSKYNFDIKDGTSIEDDWHNFTALNMSENHPARQMHDTFYMKSKDGKKPKLLRTHTSNVQIRTMKNGEPPFRFISPGRTYRSDSDVTHTPMFHQIEGLLVDENINMGHLKYIIIDFIKSFFEKSDIEVQFRPSFFPFTEPSAEVDIRMNKNDNWLEVLGCGMVHPNVLKNVGIDTNKYRGFAFGAGVERLAMLKYGMKDLRQFFEGDLRWHNHYNFAALDIPTLAGGLTR